MFSSTDKKLVWRGLKDLPNVHAVHKWVAAIGWPQALVGELVDIPHELVHDLRELDGMGRRARAATISTSALAISDVSLMIWRVEILAIPAGGEDDGLTDELALGVFGNGDSVGA